MQTGVKKNNKNKAIKKITIFLLILIILGLSYFVLWNNYLQWHEETEDAYINSHQNIVTSQISGNIIKIMVDDTQYVKKGQLIAQIDKTDYLLALDNAKVDLENSIRKYYSLLNNSNVSKDTLKAKKTEYLKNEVDYKRNTLSMTKGLISKEDYDIIKNNYNQSLIQYNIAKNNYENDIIQSFSTTIHNHPEVEKMIVGYKKAYIDLLRTDIYAPIEGTIAKRSIYLGQRVSSNQNLLTIVDTQNSWVDANLKETQLKNLKLGQSVEIVSDINKKVYSGRIVGISSGSGSSFSLLPAQNATGNWIKVVQRIPVKISIDKDSFIANGPLPIGSSLVVNIDTNINQPLSKEKSPSIEDTNVFNIDHLDLDNLINVIIKDNVLSFNQ